MSEPNTPETERRRHVRMAVHWAGDLSAEGTGKGSAAAGGTMDCTVLDISPGGAKLQTSDPLPAATPVRLKLSHGGDFEGIVAWQQGSFMGLAFHDEQQLAA